MPYLRHRFRILDTLPPACDIEKFGFGNMHKESRANHFQTDFQCHGYEIPILDATRCFKTFQNEQNHSKMIQNGKNVRKS